MKNAQPVQKNRPGAKALSKQAHYTPLHITVKALHAAAIVALTLNAGGLAV